jgi:threonine dehydratase
VRNAGSVAVVAAHPPPVLDDVVAARHRIGDTIRATPAVHSPVLSRSAGVPIWLKAECLQETGSFKVRGAANALGLLGPDARAAGVVAVSSGNHGRAVAHVAKRMGCRATVCLSQRVPPSKVAAIERLGARVVVAGPDQDDADAEARRLVADEGLTFIHPFDDPAVIAGQGTIGLEIVDQVPGVDAVVVPLSGGGLISGIGVAVAASARVPRVIGVSQERGPAMHLSLIAGRPTDVVEEDTLADALAGGLGPVNRYTFDMCRALVQETALVSEDEIADAMRLLHAEHGLRAEGGGAVGVAAVLAGRIRLPGPSVIVVSGGNVPDDVFDRVVRG